jgi:hypothetical protein
MPRGIQLRRLEIQNANHWHLRVFRLRIEVAQIFGDMPRHVFVYRRRPANPYTGEIFDEFCAVASVVDLSEYPAGAPDPDGSSPFFRQDFIEVDLPSQVEFEKFWELIQTHVCALVDRLNLADQLVMTEAIWCGDQPPDPGEPSESESEMPSESVSESESESMP